MGHIQIIINRPILKLALSLSFKHLSKIIEFKIEVNWMLLLFRRVIICIRSNVVKKEAETIQIIEDLTLEPT
jgi:hypothetical protein